MTFFLQHSVQRRIGKGGIATKDLGTLKWRYRSITGKSTRRQNFA